MAPKLVVIKWLDAHQYGDVGDAIDDAQIEEVHGALETVTAGWLLRSDEKGVTLCSDLQNQGETLSYRNAHFTPRAMIISEQVIPVKTRRKAKVTDVEIVK